MQIIIPMSGTGERFKSAGYEMPKPLIKMEGKPMVAHIVDLFPQESNLIFICNQSHLDNPKYEMRETIKYYCPSAKIIPVNPHKLGPVHAVLQIESIIDKTSPTIVNYCDFSCYWDWKHFLKFVNSNQCEGAIPAYKGFHPHSLGNTNYAYMKEKGGWVQDIQEKAPFTSNRMEEYASSGTYYFSSGQIMLDAFHYCVRNGLQVNGEYYVSLAYKYLLNHGLSTAIYELEHFMQWGTPEDVEEYNYWSDTFKNLTDTKNAQHREARGALIMLMAGEGERFKIGGYKKSKPLIEVANRYMALQALKTLPPAQNYIFVMREDEAEHIKASKTFQEEYPSSQVAFTPTLTSGQAESALVGLDAIDDSLDVNHPYTFAACDSGVIFTTNRYTELLDNPDVDVIVWTARKHFAALRSPQAFGWAETDGNKIVRISVKRPLNNPENDPMLIGAFTFRRASDFRKSVKHLMQNNVKVNDEYYIDSCINEAIRLGLNCQLFDVDNYISWGTPNELKTFEYWRACFNKWPGHSYTLSKDVVFTD